MAEPWCVLLASRLHEHPEGSVTRFRAAPAPLRPRRVDPLVATLRRATAVTSPEKVATVMAGSIDPSYRSSFANAGIRNLLVQPKYIGTAHEVLFTLVLLESRVSAATPILFLPTDHLVKDEVVMTNALLGMAEWIADEPGPVYLLGAVPQGPHDQLGYIVPWLDSMLMPTGVYEFVEMPVAGQARRLINAGGLWNTFIFGGTLASMFALFRPRFDQTIAALRAALEAENGSKELMSHYDRTVPADLSKEVFAPQTDKLNVMRLLSCGWWPIKAPASNSVSLSAALRG